MNEPRSRAVGWITFALFAGSIWYGVWSISPPSPVEETGPLGAFSSGRAMRHLEIIAAEPHPLGSEANARVRKYLTAELERLGFVVEVQESAIFPGLGPLRGERDIPPLALANIIARLAGQRAGPAVALACHYDSAPMAPGAGDDGAAVAAILETARAVRSGPPLQNDLIILITDGEEAGLLGATEFVGKHPLAHQIGVIFNYDGRGCGGPSILMETSSGNGRLIREFSRAAPYRLGASLANVVYQYLPNSTDMTVFREHNLKGLNFCIAKGLVHYHQPTDSLQNLDQGTVQQIGANALALARHFGNLDLTDLRGDEEIFFSPCGMFFVHYPAYLNRPLVLVLFAVVIAGMILLVRRGLPRIGGLVGGIGASLLIACCALAPVLALSLWMMEWAHIQRALVNGDLPNGDLFLAGFSALGVAGGTGATALLRRQMSLASLAAGGTVIWLGLAGTVCAMFPAAGYQFLWPLAWGSLGSMAAVGFWQPDCSTRRRVLSIGLVWLATMGVVVQIAPIIYLVGITFGSAKVWMPTVPLALVILILAPCWELIAQAHRWFLPVASAVIGTVLLALGQ